MDDDIMAMFVEDTREHLADIEACLMDMESHGADIDEELVNKVFRAAHSIKGGAGFLNLGNVRDLGHRLENVLHMIRGRELVPDSRAITILLHGFDRLRALVEHADASDREDISGLLAELSGLAVEHLPPDKKAVLAETVDITLPDGRVLFTEDRLSLEQAAKGGRLLYLVEYDLIHDVHARKKTPLDIFATMEASGLIVDCRVDLAAVGDLDAPPANSIPLFVLFATIVEPDVVGYLFALAGRRIRALDTRALLGRPVPPEPAQAPRTATAEPGGQAWNARFGTLAAAVVPGRSRATVTCDPGQAGETVSGADLQAALAACLERGLEVELGFPDEAVPGLSGLAALASAARSFAARGLWLGHAGEVPRGLADQARRAGFTAGALAGAGIGAGLFIPGQA